MLKIIKLILCIFHERVKKLQKSCTEQADIRQAHVRHYTFPARCSRWARYWRSAYRNGSVTA